MSEMQEPLSLFMEYQGVEQPSTVLVVSRRWDLQGNPWQILHHLPDRTFDTFTCADLNALMVQFVQILGVNLIVHMPEKTQ